MGLHLIKQDIMLTGNYSCWVFTEHQKELPASLPFSQFRSNSLPTKVRAHGVITLGKHLKASHFSFYCVIFTPILSVAFR